MKTMSFGLSGLALVLTAIAFTGCSGGGGGYQPVAGPVTKLTVEPYPVSGILKETDGFAMPGTVALSAKDANGNAVNLYSDKSGGQVITSVTALDDGNVSFFVDKNAKLPVTISASGSSTIPNHLGSSSKFTVTQAGTTFFAINIIDLDVPATGVVPHLENGTLDVDDSLQAPFSLQVTSTQVTIPAATIFTDAAGNHLKGTVKASLTAFASSTTTAPIIDPAVFLIDPELEGGPVAIVGQSDLENFPGGLNNKNAGAGAGYFVTAGFVAVNITDASGKQAKKIANGGSFTMRLNIPDGTVDPNTDTLLKKGDSIPIFTYDETTLLWKPEVVGGLPVVGTVDQDAGGLFVMHTTDHFSFWNLGWTVTTPASFCATATINLLSDLIAYPFNLKATISKQGTKVINTLLTGFKPANDSTITVQNVPNVPLDIVFTDAANKVIFSKAKYNLCTKPALTATYTAPPAKKAVPVTVNVTEYCRQDVTKVQVVPSTSTQVAVATANKPGALPPIAYTPISYGITNAAGTFIHQIAAGTYEFSAFDRRTNTYVKETVPVNPVTVVKATPLTVSVKIPVDCILNTGTTGGTGVYAF